MTTLLLVHAWPMDASMWDAQVKALNGEVDVLAPHLPGFGGTPGTGEVLTMEAIASSLVGELDTAGVERAVVCGLSIGGYATFEMWRRYPERIEGLILADARSEADDEAGRERRRALAEKVRAGGSNVVADAPPALLSEGADPALWDRVKGTIRRQSPEAIAAAALGMAERPDSGPTLATIDVPTSVVVGSADTLTPPHFSEAMTQAIPEAELVTLEGAGHLANLEDPDGFVEAIRGLLKRVG
jgi:pimeloyl-ACP methyl ester carboxylesterase